MLPRLGIVFEPSCEVSMTGGLSISETVITMDEKGRDYLPLQNLQST